MILALVLLLASGSPASAASAAEAAPCVPQKVAKRVVIDFPDGSRVRGHLVDTPESREKGLMCVTKMPRGYGMLFAFPMEMDLGFWMKNTLVSLDLVWIGADKRVTAIAPRLKASRLDTPDDQVARAGGRGLFVLELAAGEAARRKLKVGDRLSFDASASAR